MAFKITIGKDGDGNIGFSIDGTPPGKDEILGCLEIVKHIILSPPPADAPRVQPASAATLRRLPGMNGERQ
jgi:hypothetical protein